MRKLFPVAKLVIAILLLSQYGMAQIPDLTFSSDGEAGPLPHFSSFSGEQQSMAIQADGKIVIAGWYRFDDGSRAFAAMRLNSDGSTDNSFGTLGVKIINFENDSYASVVAIQPDGKIILAGSSGYIEHTEHTDDPRYDIVVVRLLANSAPDLTFGIKTFHFGNDFRYRNIASSIAVQTDGKILIGGGSVMADGGPVLMRLNTNGTLDDTFSDDGYLVDAAYVFGSFNSCLVQANGQILALASRTETENKVMRFNSTGTLDNSFGTSGSTTISVLTYTYGNSMALQPDGKIVIVGGTNVPTNTHPLVGGGLAFWLISRLNTNGSFDNGFGSSGKKAIAFGDVQFPTSDQAASVFVLPSGKIIVGGSIYDTTLNILNLGVLRLTSSGARDDNFGDDGMYLFVGHGSTASDGFALQADGKLVFNAEEGGSSSSDPSVYVNRLILLRPPKITCPSNITVDHDAALCTALVSFSATATGDPQPTLSYKIGTTTITSPYNFPVGVTTVDATATNGLSPDATCSFTVSVVDNTDPVIANESPSVSVLSPSNHLMKDVTINYTVVDECPLVATLTVTSNEPVNGVADGDTDPDWIVLDDHHVQLRAERSAVGDGRVYTITITATDGSGNSAVKTVEVRVPHNIKNPHSGQAFKMGSTIAFEGEFWDKSGNSHSAKWMLDDNLSVKGIVTEPVGNKNGKVTGSYKFTAPGVYKLQMNVTDQNGITNYANTNGDLEAIVVIYDPNGGYTYGGGYYNSPAGALKSNPLSTGKASYGFAMNYFKNSTNPKGETQFEFKVGSFEFNALNFEYLVISNSMSQFKGTGKITGGQSGVGFTMTVVDGQLDGSGVDKIRMKIYNRSNGAVIYDNQPGASDAALPIQAVGTNSTIVISGTNSSLTQSNTTQKAEMEATAPEVLSELDIIAYPNPSADNFSISVKANPVKEKITMQIIDMYGRIIETRNVNANSPIRFGDRYSPGTYFVRIIQGKEHKELKLIKLSD